VSNFYDDEHSHPAPTEGVRILGAEEARAGLSTHHDDDADDDEPGIDEPQVLFDEPTVEPAAEPTIEPTIRPIVLSPDPLVSSSGPESALSEPTTGEIPPLPHWSEPPTGAVPAIFADDGDDADELDAWATGTGSQPRFRAEGSDWAESDFAQDLSGEHRIGALSNEGPIDEEAEFARDLAEKRRAPRTRSARTTTARRPTRTRPVAAPADDFGAREASAPRDLPTAILTAAAVAVVAIVCFTQGRNWTVVLAALVVGVATLELASTLQKRGLRPATLVVLVASTLMPIATKNYGTNAYPVFFGLVVIVSMLWFLWEITPGRPLPGVASTLLVFMYVGGLGGFAGLLLVSSNGVRLLLGVALCVIAYDVLGFFVGSQFGHTAIAPKISPHKTVEGTVAGMVAAIVVGAAIVGQFSPWTVGKGAVLGLLVAGGAFLGDLCESMLKRDLGVKDFGSLLPGHGGVLDRFDSLLFCLPIAYYLAIQLKIF
jgi:phosphatidate cytidylyltransferase